MWDHDRAEAFGRDCIAAWNTQDLARILAHYGDEVVLHSPLIARVMGGRDSRIRGKTALAEYWGRALANAADLRFELQAAYVGSDALTVAYTNHRGRWASEGAVRQTAKCLQYGR